MKNEAIIHIVSTENRLYQSEPLSIVTEDGIDLRIGVAKQKIKGFGGCFNDLGWEALKRLPIENQKKVLDALFLPEECGLSYGRVPIGANDFSTQWFSCDETEMDYSLNDFQINHDKEYTIPYVKEAMNRVPDFKVFASPWSPPTWMKTKKAYNYGTLKMDEETLTSYANYFVKFIKAYEKEGICVNQIHVQNEPTSDQKFPSCKWTGLQMGEFVAQYLGPKFDEENLDTQIWIGTINGPFVDYMLEGYSSPFSEFFEQYLNRMLQVKEVRRYISGIGVQWGGKHMLPQLRAAYPQIPIMQTESECGDGKNTWEHMEYIFLQLWLYFYYGAESYTYWNMVLGQGGISTWGWEQNSMVVVDEEGRNFSFQPEYYLMRHISSYVKKGATYMETYGEFAANSIAFQNTDGSLVVVVCNAMEIERQFSFAYKKKGVKTTLLPHSIHTFVLD
jgi:glucosylceramidase